MTVQQDHIRLEEPALNGVATGLALANRIIQLVKNNRAATLELAAVERLTPSFANALVMTIIENVGMEAFRSRVALSNASPLVRESWDKAVERYERGVRLSTQRPEVA